MPAMLYCFWNYDILIGTGTFLPLDRCVRYRVV